MSFNSKYTGLQVEEILDFANLPKIIKHTHQELYNLYISNSLIPGLMYAITDYECSYKHPSGGNDAVFEMTIPSEDVKYIILTALDTNRFDYSVLYIRHEGFAKILECKYAIDPEEVPFTKGMEVPAKGAVFYMKDEYENECSYDFKHVKFRRYAIKDITANMDINDGTGGVAGPYKCMMTDTAYKFSDTRAVIGSGDDWDKTFIPALFNGKWGSLVSYSVNIDNYSDDFIIQNVKPYQNELYPWDKYLSWQTNMRESGGLSSATNRGSSETINVYGQANVEVDINDYKDRYTFDYNGMDLSEMKNSVGLPRVRNMSIINTYCGHAIPSTEVLPNTVIVVSEGAIASDSTLVQASKFISDTGVAGVKNNTILLRAESGYNYARISNLEFPDGDTNTTFRCNLLILGCLSRDVKITACINNLIIGDLYRFNIQNQMGCNVLFGMYSSITGLYLNYSLLYGDFYKVLYEGDKLKNTEDGNYWYDTVWRDWFAYNIIGPNQYSSFQPHFNTNTVRSCYNKGVEWHPTNQGSSYGRCVWGTNIQYGGTSGGIKFNDLIRVDVAPGAFRSVAITNSKDQEFFNNNLPGVPTIQNCDIKSFLGNPSTIVTDLSPSLLIRLKDASNWSIDWKNHIPHERAKYLWDRSITYTKLLVDGKESDCFGGTSENTKYEQPQLLYIYDKEIKGIKEWYCVSNDNINAPLNGWTDHVVNANTTDKYVWNYTTIIFNDDTTTDTPAKVVSTLPGDTRHTPYWIQKWYAISAENEAPLLLNLPRTILTTRKDKWVLLEQNGDEVV